MSGPVLHLFLQAVALVESGANPHAVGRLGERGQFQMSPAVVASCGGFGEKEAAKHEQWIERQLLAAKVEPLPFNVALAWNAGANAVLHGKAPVRSYDYARRVCATMEALK